MPSTITQLDTSVELDALRLQVQQFQLENQRLSQSNEKLITEAEENRKKISELELTKNCTELLVWNVVQEEFMLDDTSWWHACEHYSKQGIPPENVTESMVQVYWSDHGGPEKYREHFKGLKGAIKYLSERLGKFRTHVCKAK